MKVDRFRVLLDKRVGDAVTLAFTTGAVRSPLTVVFRRLWRGSQELLAQGSQVR